MATHSSILAWKIPGTGEPSGLLSMGSHRIRHDWNDLAAEAVSAIRHFCKEHRWPILPSPTFQCGLCAPSVLFHITLCPPVVKHSVQFSSVAQSVQTLCDMNRSVPGLPVHHQLPESTQTHVHWLGDAIQPSHPLLSPSTPAFNLSQIQGLFQWVSSSHEVAKVLEFQF